jgi:hypothetical protein
VVLYRHKVIGVDPLLGVFSGLKFFESQEGQDPTASMSSSFAALVIISMHGSDRRLRSRYVI